MALIMDEIVEKLQIIKADAKNGRIRRPAYPMLILRTPKGWTGPKVVEGKQIEGTFRAHQVPIVVNSTNDKNLELLEESTFIQKDKKILFNDKDYTSFIRNEKILGQCFYIPTIFLF